MSADDALLSGMNAAGWSDGLPIVPPTASRVEQMLKGTAKSRDAVLGNVPPMYQNCTVELAAANAVMAGCKPQHFRIVLAAVEAMLQEPFNLHGVHATTMGATPVVLVSGPARTEAGLNDSHGALGSGSRANMSIGRALKLVLKNVGGAKLGGTESTTLGTPMKYGLCVAEAEERLESAGWRPYHVASRGFRAGESCVTVVACTSGPHQLVDFATRDAATLVSNLGCHLASCYAPHMPLVNECVVMVSPEHMTTLHRGGVESKEHLARCLWHTANRASARHLVRTIQLTTAGQAGAAAKAKIVLGCVLACVAFLLSLLADLLAALSPKHALDVLFLHSLVNGRLLKAPKFVSPDSFHILVTGAPAGKFSSVSPGFGIGVPPRPTANLSRACSATIEPMPPAMLDKDEQGETEAEAEAAEESSRQLLAALVKPTSDYRDAPMLPPSARLASLASSSARRPITLGLLDISKHGGATLLDRLQTRLEADHCHLRCRRFCKPTFSRPMPADLASTIQKECDAVVLALAD